MNRNIINRILVTMMLLIVYRVGTLIIAPGLPAGSLYPMFIDANYNPYDSIRRFTLLGFGISPYIGMTALLLFISVFSEKARSLLMGESPQLFKLERIILFFTVIYMIVSVIGINYYMKSLRFSSAMEWSYGEDLFNQFLFMTSKVCGGIVVIYIARVITRAGIINGVVAIILADSFYYFKSACAGFFNNKHAVEAVERIDLLTAIAVIALMVVFCVVFITSRRDVNVCDPADSEGRGEPVSMTIRVNTVGNVPVEISGSLIALVLIQIPNFFGASMTISNTVYYASLIIICIILAFLFAYMSFNPVNVLSILERFGYAISHAEEKKPDIEFLISLYRPLVWTSIIIVSILALTPLAIQHIIKIPDHPLLKFSGSYILLLCCVIVDSKNRFTALKKLESPMISIYNFNTQLEADLFLDRLKRHGIQGAIINTRALPITGTFSYWETCVPSIPYFITHRNLAGGSVAVYVKPEDRDVAGELLKEFYQQDDAHEHAITEKEIYKDSDEKGGPGDGVSTRETDA